MITEAEAELRAELREGLRACNLPVLILYGPSFSGKTRLLNSAGGIVEEFKRGRPHYCLPYDFRSETWQDPSNPLREFNEHLVEIGSRQLPALRKHSKRLRAKGDLTETIAQLADSARATN